MIEAPAPPVARRARTTSVLHGDARVDDYAWLRHKGSTEVTAYLEAENAYADGIMAHTKPLQEVLYAEMLARIKEDDSSAPYPQRGWWYYSRTLAGAQYPVYCRKAALDSDEHVLLDLNEMAQGHAFMAVGVYHPSDNGQLLAYSTDTTGFREYVLRIKDLNTGEHLPFRVENAGTAAWSADGRYMFYTVDDSAKRPSRLFRHRLGTDDHQLLYEETDEMFRISVHRSRSGGMLFVTSASHTATEVYFVPADDPETEWTLVARRSPDHEYYADHHGDHLYLLTNDTGRNFRIARAPLATTGREHWEDVVAHRDDVMLEDLDLFQNYMVVSERAEGLQRLHVTEFATGEGHTIAFPEPVYTVSTGPNRTWATDEVRFSYQSPVTPPQVIDYDMGTRTSAVRKQLEVPGYDPSLYETSRLWVEARDGAKVPVSLASRKGTPRDGSAPLYLQGYGSYGASYPIAFSSSRMSLLDRGITIAFAHVRGGGELGKPWHDAGRMLTKMHTFTDFIDVAESLISQGYTAPDRLIINGRSAGGLLMGAVVNLRPDLFKAVLAGVPFVDVINTMLDASLPLTVGEWEEWGNPQVGAEYRYMKQYCPYTNLTEAAYPVIFAKTALNDSQVMYWEPAKWVAKMRTLKTDTNPLIFRTDMGAGHGGASGRYDYLREVAEEYAFILWQAGSLDS